MKNITITQKYENNQKHGEVLKNWKKHWKTQKYQTLEKNQKYQKLPKSQKNMITKKNIGREKEVGQNPTTPYTPGETPAALGAPTAPTENRAMSTLIAFSYY